MTRPIRIDYPGALHHIFFRGNRKENIFNDNADRLQFLKFLSSARKRYGVKIYAYCLMNNHVHFLVESGPTHIGNFMGELLTNYVQYFNRRWDKVGHLLQDRYKSILVDKDIYLLTLIKYIHLNPVKDGLCEEPEDYTWSSHIEYLGMRKTIAETEMILSYLGGIREYEDLIIKESKDKFPELKRYKNYRFYGNDEFINTALNKIADQKRKVGHKRKKIELKDAERFIKKRFSNKDIYGLKPYCDIEIKRYVAVIMRDRLHYPLKEIAKIIGVNFRTVSHLYKSSDIDKILAEFDSFAHLGNWKLED